MGMFYKRRDYSTVINGKNPIVAHEFLGSDIKGKSVIIISSELPEVLGMSDRIYVMNEGKMVGEVDGKEATQEIIMSYIMKSGKGA